MSKPQTVTVFTRRNPSDTSPAIRRLVELAGEAGVEVLIPPDEVEKHGLQQLEGARLGAAPASPTDLAIVFGGDGTILATLRLFAGRQVPVLALNFGAIGFLSTFESSDLDDGLRRALGGEYEVLELPALSVEVAGGEHLAVNDISFHRQPDGRVAELGYSVVGEQLGEVRCDGLVAATAAGSTGYNLANGGPVMAWGVEGYVVSFIAPHTLTARALVVAPDDVLEVVNRSREEPVDVTTDGRRVCALEPGARMEVRFQAGRAMLAQAPGASFYNRLRDKFGRLAY